MVVLNGCSLSLEDARKIIYEGEEVVISTGSMERVKKSREAVEKIVKEKRVVYGITTGFGKFSDVLIDSDDVEEL
jgi:histidine ammonia-lyase